MLTWGHANPATLEGPMHSDSQTDSNSGVVAVPEPRPASVVGSPVLPGISVLPHAIGSAPEIGEESDPGQHFRRVFGWVALVAALVWGTFMGGFLAYHTLQPESWMVRLVEQQFAAVILVPMSGLGSFCIVLLLRLSSGPLEFKAIGFEFRGASGQVVLWVVCFIALIAAVKLLWVA